MHQCCHKPFCCNWGGKQRTSLFNKNLCFELIGLTCSFSLTQKKEGFTVKASDVASTAVQQWNELSAVVWVLSSCSFHGQLVHIYNITVFSTGPCSYECGLWKTSCSSSGDLHEVLCITAQINCSSAVALAPICNISLLCCLQLPGTPMHLPGAGGDEHSFGELLDLCIFLLVRPVVSGRSPLALVWLAKDVGGGTNRLNFCLLYEVLQFLFPLF